MILQFRLLTASQPTSSAWTPHSSNVSALFHKHSGSGWAHSGDQSLRVDCFQLISSRLGHGQLDTRTAAWLSRRIALFLSLPLVPTAVISLHTDWEQKPLTPTLTGNSQVRQPFLYKDPVTLCSVYYFLS